jgi:Cu(I)/Ag(I) efflux system membrane fusion protein
VLLTGKRALVYVKRPGTGEPVFQAREIRVGPRAGEFYPVVSGLKEGEEVVVKGNFKIDSAMQLSGKPSMINPEGGGPAAERDHSGAGMSVKESGSRAPSAGPVFSGANGDSGRAVRKALWEAYLSLQEALAADEQEEAEKSLALMNEIVEGDKQDAGREWNAFRNRIHEVTRHASHGHSIEEIRKSFEILSTVMKEVLAAFRSPLEEPVYEVFCSMAFDNKGAAWIQRGKTVANPYFGSRMLRCGDIRNEFRPSEETHHAH